MNLLLTGAWSDANNMSDLLEQAGHQIQFLQQESDPLPCPYTWIEGVVCNGLFLHHPIEKFTELKYIQLTSAGFDRIDMDYVQKNHITIHNARGVYSIPMAEFALCGVLQLYKKSHFFYRNQQQHRWEKSRDLLELCGKTVCIVGCGSVGTECAKRFSALGCNVLGADISPSDNPSFSRIFPMHDLPQVLALSNIVILTLPLTKETHHMFDSDLFSCCPRHTVLVNIARGLIIDTDALMHALTQGHLMGAVLDVFEEEPLPPDSPLWNADNVILTPHNSFVSSENASRLNRIIFENLKVFLS